MKRSVRKMLVAILIVVVIGCSPPDDRVVRIAMESTQRQAEQNREMSQLNREVAEGTKRIAEAVAESREEILAMEADLQEQRMRLEEERRLLADERYRESLLAPIFDNLGVLLIVCLPLVICCLLLLNLRKETDDDTAVCDLLIEEITANEPQLLASLETRRAIEHEPTLPEDE